MIKIFLSLVLVQASFIVHALNKAGLRPLPFDTATIKTTSNNFKADISFLFIDFKYDNQLKICEFGRAKTSGLSNIPVKLLINNVSTPMFAPFWPFFWHYLSHLNLPVWFVGTKPRDRRLSTLNETNNDDTWNSFIAMGGHYQPTFDALEKDPSFKRARHKTPFNQAHLDHYKGIVICNPLPSDTTDIEAFKQRHPYVIFLDDIGSKYGRHKHVGASLFQDDALKQFKPRWKVFQKNYNQILAHDIISAIKSDIVVIKPVGALFGKGVIIVNKQDLDITLKYICKHDNSFHLPSDIYEQKSQTYSHWQNDIDDIFIVEEYCPSTPMMFYQKYYDPTFRIYFALRHDAGNIYVDIFGGYLKLPVKSLMDEGSLTEKHKTVPYFKSKNLLSALSIPDDLFKKITHELKIALPKIYHKMLEYDEATKTHKDSDPSRRPCRAPQGERYL